MAEEAIKWEYTATLIFAHIENKGARQYISSRWPKWTDVKKYSPETTIPQLDQFGADGWELVHMKPVNAGNNADIGYGSHSYSGWKNTYFCAFKRPMRS